VEASTSRRDIFSPARILTTVGVVLFPTMALLNRYYTRRVERPAIGEFSLWSIK
jgi:hypothetical protein